MTGTILGTVVQNHGPALPRVTLTLSGVGAPQTAVSDADGTFRFEQLPPGMFTVKAELSGFGTSTRAGVRVNPGRNTVVDLVLNPSARS